MKNPKIEVYKVILSPTSEKNKDVFSFRELFISKYDLDEKTKDKKIYNSFYEDVFKTSDYKENDKIRKAFRLSNDITLNSNDFYIHGVMEGGTYDVGKTAGNRKTKRESRKFHKDVIIQDDFYFYCRLNLIKKLEF